MHGLLLTAALLLRSGDSLLVSTEWLATHRVDPDLVVLHVAMEKTDYDRGHIAGARFLDPHRLMGMSPPGVELPPVAQIDSVLEALGITAKSRIVYYGDTWMAPRVFLALDYVGLGDRTAMLDGGLPAWRAEGRAVSTETPVWQRGSLTLTARPEILASAEWIRARLGDSTLVLVDGRSPGEYAATDSSERLPRFGHIPGGVNLPWEETFTNESAALDGTPSRLKPPDALRKLLATAGLRANRDLVTYCTVGLRASHLYFVARYLGLRPRVYDGSMSEWSRRPELPMVRGSNPR
jgi:thiosulfate/3-mercaptopyruvate sulfurtransferase